MKLSNIDDTCTMASLCSVNLKRYDGYVNSLEWSGGMERWTGLLEWSTGATEWSTGVGVANFIK